MYFLVLKREDCPDIEWYNFNQKELIRFIKELPDKLEFIKIIKKRFDVGSIKVKINYNN